MPATAPETVGGGARGALGAARAERPSPFSLAGFVIMLVAMAVEAIVLVILLKPEPIALAKQVQTGKEAPKLTMAELLAPSVIVPEVVVSVPVKESGEGGMELMTAVVSVSIKLGKAEGRSDEELDVRYLEKVYVPMLEKYLPEFRHKLIMALGPPMTYTELRARDTQNKILDDLKRELNEGLRDYGLAPRVRQVLWNSFHFD